MIFDFNFNSASSQRCFLLPSYTRRGRSLAKKVTIGAETVFKCFYLRDLNLDRSSVFGDFESFNVLHHTINSCIINFKDVEVGVCPLFYFAVINHMIDERIREQIERIVSSEGMNLVHLEFKEGKNAFLRLYIDKPGGVTLDDCQNISEQVGTMLDVEDPIPQHYTLEVSSPGLDRQLFSESDFVKFIGKEVKVSTNVALHGRTHFTGRISRVEDGIITIVEGSEHFDLPFASIQRANLKLNLKNLGSAVQN